MEEKTNPMSEQELRSIEVCFKHGTRYGIATHNYFNGYTSLEIIGDNTRNYIAAGHVKAYDVIRIDGYATDIMEVSHAPVMSNSDYMVSLTVLKVADMDATINEIDRDKLIKLIVPGDFKFITPFNNEVMASTLSFGERFRPANENVLYVLIDIQKMYDTHPNKAEFQPDPIDEGDEDDDIKMTDVDPCPMAQPITHDDAMCVKDDEDDDDGEEGETPKTDPLPDPVPAEHKDDEEDMSDDEFWQRVKDIDAQTDRIAAEKVQEKVKNLKDVLAFTELKPRTARYMLKRMAFLSDEMETCFSKLARQVKKTNKLSVNDPLYRNAINLSGQLRYLMAMLHIDGDALLTADNLSLYDAGIATSSAKINLWEAESMNSALINNESMNKEEA